jgi:hypothetical protein
MYDVRQIVHIVLNLIRVERYVKYIHNNIGVPEFWFIFIELIQPEHGLCRFNNLVLAFRLAVYINLHVFSKGTN